MTAHYRTEAGRPQQLEYISCDYEGCTSTLSGIEVHDDLKGWRVVHYRVGDKAQSLHYCAEHDPTRK